jgi:hypothetical protein
MFDMLDSLTPEVTRRRRAEVLPDDVEESRVRDGKTPSNLFHSRQVRPRSTEFILNGRSGRTGLTVRGNTRPDGTHWSYIPFARLNCAEAS